MKIGRNFIGAIITFLLQLYVEGSSSICDTVEAAGGGSCPVVVEEEGEECGMWLAESSIVGAGLGMYSGRPVKKGERVGEPDIVIPIIDPDKRIWCPLHEFTWNGDVLSDLFFENSFITDALIPGLGAQANCHMGLNNLDLGTNSFDSSGLHRSRDPAVGSFSPRYNYAKVAEKDILPGEELFISYGEQWFLDREEMVGTIPFEKEYQLSDELGQKILPYIDVLPKDLWDMIYDLAEPRLQNALPTNFMDYKEITELFGGSTARAFCPNSVRSLSWLKHNGYCIDRLHAAPSTIPDAGRGAFTKRSFQKDQVITVSPAIHFPLSYTNIKEQFRTDDGEHYFANKQTIKRRQLLLNYAFGHDKSKVLFVPYGPMVNFINHHSSPNAYVRWASSSKHHKDKLLQLTADEAIREKYGLMIEYVALRDIAPNEEIFIDYGESWVQAWKEHVEHFQPNATLESEQYVSASEFRNLHADEPIRTLKEQQTNPYPPNLQTACIYCAFGVPSDPQSVFSMLTDDLGTVDVRTIWNASNHDFGCLLPCTILSRGISSSNNNSNLQPVDHDYYYSALISPLDNEFLPGSYVMDNNERHIVYHIPMSKVIIVDKEYTTDIHIPNAFRHHINAPEGMFPDSWLVSHPRRVVFSPEYLEPGQIEQMKWQREGGNGSVSSSEQPVAEYAYLLGIPPSLTESLLEYCNLMGITKRFQELLYKQHHKPLQGTYEDFLGLQWYVQRPDAFWNSNMHWISPANAEAHEDYLRVLGEAGFDRLLEVIGTKFDWEGLVCFHVTFIGVSECDQGYDHYDFHDTGGKGFNIIIPLILANDSTPELDFFPSDSDVEEESVVVGSYKYRYHVASMLGDNAIHSTSAINYTSTKEFRMAATVYIADVQPWNVDSILLDYTQAYPPKSSKLLLNDAGKHWTKGNAAKLPSGPRVFQGKKK